MGWRKIFLISFGSSENVKFHVSGRMDLSLSGEFSFELLGFSATKMFSMKYSSICRLAFM